MRFADIIIESPKAWFIPADVTGLIEADLDSECSQFIGQNKGKVILSSNQFGPIQKIGSDIVIAPVFAEGFYRYNLDSGIGSKLYIEDYQKCFLRGKDKYGKFQTSFSYGDKVYFVGAGYSGIAKIDTKTWEGKCINVPLDADSLFGRGVGICGGKVYIPIRNKNEMVIYHMESDYCEKQNVGRENCIALCIEGNKLCCVPITGKRIEIYDIESGNIQEVFLPEDIKGKNGDRWYCTAVSHCGFVWIFPFYSNMILRLDMKTGNAVCVHRFIEDSQIYFINAGIYDENTIWGFEGSKNELILLDCKSLCIRTKRIMYPQNAKEYINAEKYMCSFKERIIQEGYLELKNLIEYVLYEDNDYKN